MLGITCARDTHRLTTRFDSLHHPTGRAGFLHVLQDFPWTAADEVGYSARAMGKTALIGFQFGPTISPLSMENTD